jgi:hypothetical protein
VNECPTDMSACQGTCVDVNSDPYNCGSCHIICISGQACHNGICRYLP